ncbi:hypothetical protein ANCDUO_00202 [Ancylostoma duodenale]|uniref:Uncharacterized protein n=1 Tax=Ancylostoma duodenale TaxID=51022 RepID=A0A0C2HCP5_9BILA|nr:hypothetical protein ANCDUO_00202 [Ancylostoma duodenale]
MAIYGEEFGIRIYDHVGSFMEMLTLLYSSLSFALYCSMSNDFLTTFRTLFMPWWNDDKDAFSGSYIAVNTSAVGFRRNRRRATEAVIGP